MAQNIAIAASQINQIVGTVLTSGTIAAPLDSNGTLAYFDTQGHTLMGLVFAGTMVAGTITVQVSSAATTGSWYTLKDKDGANIGFGPLSGEFALSTVDLAPLISYDRVRFVLSSAQTNGGQIILITKA